MAPVISGQGTSDTAEATELHDAMPELDENQKTVNILKFFEYLMLTQIAQIMKLPGETPKTHLHRAFKALRLELEKVFQ